MSGPGLRLSDSREWVKGAQWALDAVRSHRAEPGDAVDAAADHASQELEAMIARILEAEACIEENMPQSWEALGGN